MKITRQLRLDALAADDITPFNLPLLGKTTTMKPLALSEAQGQMEACKICH